MPVQIPPQPGNRVWLIESETYPLPQGWFENQQVTVIHQAGDNFVVRTLDGDGEAVLDASHLDGGWIFALPGGEEVHESNPAAIAALKRGVERQLQLDLPEVTRSAVVWLRVLKRNGVDMEVSMAFR